MTLSRRLNYVAGYLMFMAIKYALIVSAYYLAYGPLTIVVLICFTLLFLFIFNLSALILPSIDVSTLEQLITWLNLEEYSRMDIDEQVVMKYFGQLTLLTTIVSFTATTLVKLIAKKEINISAKKQIIASFTSIGVLGFLTILSGFAVYPFGEALGLIPFMVVLEIAAIFSYGLYVVCMSVAHRLNLFIQYPEEYLPFTISHSSHT